ncbi:F-box protein At1g10780 [Amaranthus tricolor]|uniref:F-box protein At1g10780 n=1 Tax=Amaranthus tricolor TaxID=29722 RepID=UPI002588ADF2|nr:F-box protein At1g10780 [Amaranthus tricolor]
MEFLPDAVLEYILSYINNARDVASCISVSKRWQESIPYIKRLYFPRNIFDTSLSRNSANVNPDETILRIVSMVEKLEELIVYCPFSSSGLTSWLSVASKSLKHLELRIDGLSENPAFPQDSTSKLDCLGAANNLESLTLWGVFMSQPPRWEVFHNLRNLEIVGVRMEDHTLVDALKFCPNVNRLSLLGCEGVRSVSINLKDLEECRLDFYGIGNNSVFISCPKLTNLEIQGGSSIRVPETKRLRNMSISNSGGKVCLVDFGKLVALETLSMRGVQWRWDAISKMLELASEVKHLFMKVEFTGDFENLIAFPAIDFAEFFNAHPKLKKFDIHGAMFAALCSRDSLKNIDSNFTIPCLEEAVITIRSPLNAEQKISTLESIVKYAGNLKKLVLKILQMKSCHNGTDDFFEDVWKFTHIHRKIARIE